MARRLPPPGKARPANAPGGLGLGLAIVDRLCGLLGHRIELTSTMGKGSRFSVVVPAAAAHAKFAVPQAMAPLATDVVAGKLVVVIDDDAMVLDGMGGLLHKWGCRFLAAGTPEAAIAGLGGSGASDLIISDYRLANGRSTPGGLRDYCSSAIWTR